jgi:hypothetical protein
MNNYRSSTPRVALGIAAVAMTAVTFGVFIVMPATIESGGEGVRKEAAAKVVTPAVTEAVIIPARIEVLGVRETALASTPSTTLTQVKAGEADRPHLLPRPPAQRVHQQRDGSVIQKPELEY